MNTLAHKKISHHSGFTLVEFIVIMSIFAIMVGVVLFNFTSFRSRVTLDNLAHDIALSIRQIQTSAGASQTADLNNPKEEYFRGLAFTMDTNGQIEKKLTQYQSASTEESRSGFSGTDEITLDTISINTPDKIVGISKERNLDSINDSAPDFIESNEFPVSIAFKRFRTQAYFNDANGPIIETPYLCVYLSSPDGTDQEKRIVCISQIGQISVH